MTEKTFNPMCFKIHADFSKIDQNDFVKELVSFGNVSFYNKDTTIFLNLGTDETVFRDFITKFGMGDFFLERILPKTCENQASIFDVWFKENYEKQLAMFIEENEQDTLRKINENVKKYLQKEKEKEGTKNGRSGSIKEARASEKDSASC